MVRRDTATLKAERLVKIRNWIQGTFNQGSKKISIEGALTWIEMNIGLTQARAFDYLALIVRATPRFQLSGDPNEIALKEAYIHLGDPNGK